MTNEYPYNPAPQYDLYIDYASDLTDIDLSAAEQLDLSAPDRDAYGGTQPARQARTVRAQTGRGCLAAALWAAVGLCGIVGIVLGSR